jgi:uncharacterized integral membrane protein
MMRILLALFLSLFATATMAQTTSNYSIGTGTIPSTLTFLGWACPSTTICTGSVPTDSNGNVFATSGNPFFVRDTAAETSLATIATNTGTFLPAVSHAQTAAAASSLVAKSSAGKIVNITGSAVSGSYIMVFDATAAPSDGAVSPLKCWGPMSAAGPFVFAWGEGPVFSNSTGITVVSSSTGCFNKTATNAAFISVEYQ